MSNKKFGRLAAALLLAALFTAGAVCTAFAAKSSARDAADSVVLVATQGGTGSGFAIGEVGKPVQYIVTNYHVIGDAYESGQTTATVYFSAAANRFMQAEIYWKDAQKDLAVLRLPEPTQERKAMVLCPSDKADLSGEVFALGYPGISSALNDFMKYDTSDIVVTRGGIAKTARVQERDCYQIDVQISPGNSGGPLVNNKGQVLGINTFSVSRTGSKDQANYAVMIDELILSVDQRVIPLTIVGEGGNGGVWTVVLCAVVVLCLAAAFLILRRRKRAPAPSAPVGGSGPAVVGLSGPHSGERLPVGTGLRFGRDPESCQVLYPLDAPGISARHCEVRPSGGRVVLVDLGSSYGTFAGGGKLEPEAELPLGNGDEFYLADQNNRFRVELP